MTNTQFNLLTSPLEQFEIYTLLGPITNMQVFLALSIFTLSIWWYSAVSQSAFLPTNTWSASAVLFQEQLIVLVGRNIGFAGQVTSVAIAPFLIVVELISYFARVASLAIRLFANMMAGHSLLKILMRLILSAILGFLLIETIHLFGLIDFSTVYTVLKSFFNPITNDYTVILSTTLMTPIEPSHKEGAKDEKKPNKFCKPDLVAGRLVIASLLYMLLLFFLYLGNPEGFYDKQLVIFPFYWSFLSSKFYFILVLLFLFAYTTFPMFGIVNPGRRLLRVVGAGMLCHTVMAGSLFLFNPPWLTVKIAKYGLMGLYILDLILFTLLIIILTLRMVEFSSLKQSYLLLLSWTFACVLIVLIILYNDDNPPSIEGLLDYIVPIKPLPDVSSLPTPKPQVVEEDWYILPALWKYLKSCF